MPNAGPLPEVPAENAPLAMRLAGSDAAYGYLVFPSLHGAIARVKEIAKLVDENVKADEAEQGEVAGEELPGQPGQAAGLAAQHPVLDAVEVEEAGSAIARMTVRDDMVNGFDVCHGGLIFSLADTAFAFACNGYDAVTYASQADIEFVRPARLGDALVAVAREDYRGRKTGFYTVEVTNQDDQLVAMFRGRSAGTEDPIL